MGCKDRTRNGEAHVDTDETSSLLSKGSSSSPGDDPYIKNKNKSDDHRAHHLDIRGFALLPRPEFWQLFLLMGILTGIGLMTINNIGNNAHALWRRYDDSTTPSFIAARQLQHVTIISLTSFLGRLLSGIGSDLIVTRLHASRFWCLFISATVFCIAQLCALFISNPHLLFLISALTGLAYGFVFGVFPSLVAHAFGVAGMSTNWGTVILSPVICGNVFNLLYGVIYDKHSMVKPGGERVCEDGLECYRAAYLATLFAGLAGIGVVLWSVWHERRVHARSGKKGGDIEHQRGAEGHDD
ncbi:MAG: hypothetical protein Q9227_001597 [Pyrenula ochraceoflavens]